MPIITNFTQASGAIGRARAALIAFGVAFGPFLVGSAIVGGLMGLYYWFERIAERSGSIVTNLDRIRQGAVDLETLTQGQREIDNMRGRREALQRELDAARRLREERARLVAQRPAGAPVPLAVDPAALDGRIREIQSQIETFDANIRQREADLRGARLRGIEALADGYFRNVEAQVREAWRVVNQAYAEGSREFDKELRDAQRRELLGDTSGDTEEQVRERQNERIRANLRERLQIIETETRKQQEFLNNQGNVLDDQARANASRAIAGLGTLREQLERELAEFNQQGGVQLSIFGSRQVETETNRAQALLNNTAPRIAELRAQIEGANPEAAKMDERLRQIAQRLRTDGQTLQLNPALIRQLEQAAELLGNLEAEWKKLQRVAVLDRQVDNGLNQARADLERYTQALTNPDIPEAQRSFVTFQTQMMRVLDELGTKLDTSGDEYLALAAKIRLAIDTARQANVAQSEVNLERDAERARIRVAERGQQRFEIEKQQIQDRIDLLLAQRRAENLLANLPEEEGLARIRANGQALIAAAQADADRAIAGAGRRAENTITSLRGRVAELQEQIKGAGGEWAKWSATLGTNAATPAGQQILALAREIEGLEDRLERLNNAYGTLERLRRQAMEGRESLGIANQMGDEAGGILRPYLEAQAQGLRAIEQIKRDRNLSQQEIEASERQLAERLAGIGQGVLATQQQNWADQTRTLRQGLATSRADRRAEALESVSIEENRARRLIELANLTVEQRRIAEERLQAYLEARRAQVDRETESALQRQIREYSNLGDNLENAFASAFDGMNDALTEFVMTGKLSFKDLADSIIRDITRIALRAATSQVLGMIIGSVGARAIPSTAGSLAGSSFDSFGTPVIHSGGMVGSSSLPTRNVPMGLFANAPRLHKGGWIKNDEVPAILQRGEAVFTADQLAELGRLNRSYSFVEGMMGRLVRAATDVPGSAMPAMPSVGVSGMGGSVPPVTVNIVNQSGQPLEAVTGTPRMDVEGMIIDVVVNNMQRPGRMRDAVRGVV